MQIYSCHFLLGVQVLPAFAPRCQLGAGSFGRVFLMEHKQTRARVAVKTLKRERIEALGMGQKVQREIEILLRLRHPNVIRLYQVHHTPKYVLLIMEYAANGELFEFITERGRLGEAEARRIFQQIIAALECCHSSCVVHRDLKPENILLDQSWAVKVADFGLGNFIREGHFLKTSCGSPNYAAPEVISGALYCGPEVDLWSCGVVLYTLLCGRLPFDEKSHGALYAKIKSAAYPRPTHISPAAQDLLSTLLLVDPTLRATLPEVRRHPWFLPSFIPQQMVAAGEAPPALLPPANLHLKSWTEEGRLLFRVWGSSLWQPGVGLQAGGVGRWWEAMTRVCLTLQKIGVGWKKVSPYVLHCYRPLHKFKSDPGNGPGLPGSSGRKRGGWAGGGLVQVGRKRQASRSEVDMEVQEIWAEEVCEKEEAPLGCEGQVVEYGRGGRASPVVDHGFRFEVCLYGGPDGACVVDLALGEGGGSPMLLFEVCTEFWVQMGQIAAMIAARRAV